MLDYQTVGLNKEINQKGLFIWTKKQLLALIITKEFWK